MTFTGYLDASTTGFVDDDYTVLCPYSMFCIFCCFSDFPQQLRSDFRQVFIDVHADHCWRILVVGLLTSIQKVCIRRYCRSYCGLSVSHAISFSWDIGLVGCSRFVVLTKEFEFPEKENILELGECRRSTFI